MKNLLFNSVVAACCMLPPYLTSPGRAQANDWGCEVVLCLSNPGGPTQFAECRPPIQKLWRELAEGHSFPTCRGATFHSSRPGYEPYYCETGYRLESDYGPRGQETTCVSTALQPVSDAFCLNLGAGKISARVRSSRRDGSGRMGAAGAWVIRRLVRTCDRNLTTSMSPSMGQPRSGSGIDRWRSLSWISRRHARPLWKSERSLLSSVSRAVSSLPPFGSTAVRRLSANPHRRRKQLSLRPPSLRITRTFNGGVAQAEPFDFENEIFGRFTINLLDDLEIDVGTHEYRISGGSWINALTADEGGVEVRFPTLVGLTDEEFGSLASTIEDITLETGIPVHAVRAI
jgi:hypothetical protein